MDFEAYVKYLLQRHDELNLPYSFAVKLGFLGSPLIFGKAMLIWNEEPYELAGAAGFVYGTGANQYEDRHICQIEVAFIDKAYRGTTLFLRGLQELLRLIRSDNPEAVQVQFWVPAGDTGLAGLLSKFGRLPGSTQSVVNELVLYTVVMDELETYCRRFGAA
ncbi:hypothetical protein N0M98_06610 [Paenibacillus doosanensis]|nr:hypothetical protein [Paenibacillus konkukensis]MCS7459810.1 hypothetical protein [Paenibacillus doosanensis]